MDFHLALASCSFHDILYKHYTLTELFFTYLKNIHLASLADIFWKVWNCFVNCIEVSLYLGSSHEGYFHSSTNKLGCVSAVRKQVSKEGPQCVFSPQVKYFCSKLCHSAGFWFHPTIICHLCKYLLLSASKHRVQIKHVNGCFFKLLWKVFFWKSWLV